MKLFDLKKVCSTLLFCFIAVLIFYIFCFSGLKDDLPVEQLVLDTADSFQEDWQRQEQGKSVSFSNRLPQITGEDMKLAFRNFNCGIKVFVNEELVYTFAVDEQPSLGKVYSSSLCMVSLRENQSNEEIRIIYNPSSATGHLKAVGDVYLGSRNEIVCTILWKNLDMIICIIFMINIAAAALILFMMQLLQNRKAVDWIYFHIAIFLGLSAIWVFTDSLVVQMLTEKTLLYGCIVSFLSLMLLPQPLLKIASNFCPSGKKYFYCVQMALGVYMAAALAFYIGGGPDLMRTLPVLHVLMMLTGGGIVFFSVKEYREKKNIYAKYCLYSVGFLTLMMVVELILFYSGHHTDVSKLFRYSLLVLTVCFMIMGSKRIKISIEQNSKIELYRKMAYLDTMTGLKNRNAYITQLEYMKSHGDNYDFVEVVMIDINNLKNVNDEDGHDSGDSLIKHTAALIRELFPGEEMCYRIGGDEFIVFICDNEVDEQKLRRYVSEICRRYLKLEKVSLSVAVGCAGGKLGKMGRTIDELIKDADNNMYDDKIRFKESRDIRP